MDMEHQLHQLLPFSPHEHLMMASPGFFPAGGGHSPHFQAGGGFVELEPLGGVHDDGGGWVIEDDLMQFDDLFGGGDAIAAVGTGDREPWQCDDDDNDDGSPAEGPPPSVSLDDGDGDGSAPSGGGAGSEAHLEDGDNNNASPAAAARKRRDRTKTIVSERKRRVRMKEKLYELRALVPNITKMDKASIIADAVAYVKDLQAHARKLKDEVAALEARPRSLPGHEKQQQQQQHGRRATAAAAGRRLGRGEDDGDDTGRHGGARVTRVGAAGVGEGRFFVTVECERRDGVAAPLCAAVESLACFRVESSSIVRSGTDRVVSTLTLKVSEQVGDATISEGSVKLWVMAALLKEGFRPEATVEISS